MYGVNCCSVADFALRRFWTSHAFAFSVSQHRVKEVIDDPPLKSFRRQDATRKRNGKAAINYPHEPTVAEAEARAVRCLQGNALRRKREKGGKGESAQAGRPLAANAHAAPSTEVEHQLDEGLEWLEKMRGEFGISLTQDDEPTISRVMSKYHPTANPNRSRKITLP